MKTRISLQAVRILMRTELNEGDPRILENCLADVKAGRPFDLDLGVEGLRIKWDAPEEAYYLCEYTSEELAEERTLRALFGR